jgi:CAAX protease family protein
MLLPVVWAACVIAGLLYAHQQNIPQTTALAVLPAFLLEATFYYALAVDRIRQRIERLAPWTVATALFLAALLPYSAASIALGTFNWRTLLDVAYLAFFASFAYVFLPKAAFWDLLYLLIMASVMLIHLFPKLYVSPIPKLPIAVLGQVMWIRTGVFAMLAIRKVPGVGFGLWPDRRQWKVGALYYLAFLAIAVGIAWWIGFATPRWPAYGWAKTSLLVVGTFFGILWVVALGEEFFFRGLLQQWMGKWLGNEIVGLLVTSLLFGAAHLWFRAFPNWRFAIMAAIAGVFYGMAFRQTKSIRTSMVTHALVVTTWRVFFS